MADFYKNPYSFNATGKSNYAGTGWLGAGGGGMGNTDGGGTNSVNPVPAPASYGSTSQGQSGVNRTFDPYEILKGYQDRYERNKNALDQLGAVQQSQIADNYQKQGAASQQDLTSRGLSGTTVLDTMKAGNNTAMNNAQTTAAANLAVQKGNLDANLSGDTLNFMQNYKDPYGVSSATTAKPAAASTGIDSPGSMTDGSGGYSYTGPGAGLKVLGGVGNFEAGQIQQRRNAAKAKSATQFY